MRMISNEPRWEWFRGRNKGFAIKCSIRKVGLDAVKVKPKDLKFCHYKMRGWAILTY